MQGIAAWVRTHQPWVTLHLERGLDDTVPNWLGEWRPDGAIARIDNPRMVRSLQKLKIPVVDLMGKIDISNFASFDTDAAAVAKMAADHFLDRGFRHFAFCGYPGLKFSDDREREFLSYLSTKGFQVHLIEPAEKPKDTLTVSYERLGALQASRLIKWLPTIPKPLAVFACNDHRGRQVLDACAQANLRVPEEVAVLGVDDDEVVCDLANPPLSSIRPDTHRIGYEGAVKLDAILRGKPTRIGKTLIAPRGVSTRLSSDMLAIDDPIIAEAMHIIRQNACSGMSVKEMLNQMAVSRATLERRFMTVMHRSPKAELLRVRLARVSQLLAETDYSLDAIARQVGFKTASHMSVAFKQSTGKTPGQYRNSMNH
jgi:LacI family transcriptional regulator